MQKIDILNQKFNKLRVSELAESKDGRLFWKCICDCGSIVTVSGKSLRSGKTKSCGCIRRYDLTGRIFSNLTVLSYAYSKKGSSYWNCKCSCGVEKILNSINFVYGGTKSCGCKNFAPYVNMIKKYGVKSAIQLPLMAEKIKNTCIEKYGFSHPLQNKEVRFKAAISANKIASLTHWFSGETLLCQGSYEVRAINYLNNNKIDYLWQPQIFVMPNGKTYTPDLYLTESDQWIEIKGYFWGDAKEKWDWFHREYPNSELWDKNALLSITSVHPSS